MGAFIDLSEKVFGRLTVRFKDGVKSNGAVKWCCACECGKITSVDSNALRSGHTMSCGCLGRENNIKAITSYGYTKRGNYHPLYTTWGQMRHRCNSPGFRQFNDYGGRGISVCDRWSGRDGFANFVSDMGERPEGHTLDRIDNDGNYSPENCRWATQSAQHCNTRVNRFVQAFGESQTISTWSKRFGVGHQTITGRIARGVDPEIAVTHKESLRVYAKKP